MSGSKIEYARLMLGVCFIAVVLVGTIEWAFSITLNRDQYALFMSLSIILASMFVWEPKP